MTASSLAGVITAVATVLIGIGAFITSITVLVPILRGTKANSEQLTAVHIIVNHQRDVMKQLIVDQARYNERLIEALNAAGVPIPRDSSLRAPDGNPVM